jgi:hypothetical protein
MAHTGALFGDTGSGKTTQLGELFIDKFRSTGKRSLLVTCDRGGFGSIEHIIDAGLATVSELGPDDNVWEWIDGNASGKRLDDSIGLVAFDSGTAMGEALLTAITKDPSTIGTQKTQRFRVNKDVSIALNNENHYGLVQTFLLDAIWKSTWLERKGIDVWWTFSIQRGDNPADTPILGPKLAGKALTASIPKWFKYCFRIEALPGGNDQAPRHVLYLQPKQELGGLGFSFGNARYPLGATEPLPFSLEPASVIEAIKLIEAGKQQAKEALLASLA